MQSSNSDLESLAARVESLEKQNRSLKPEVVTEKPVLMDSDGETRATLCMSEGGPGLNLYDANGKERLTLKVSEWGPEPDAVQRERQYRYFRNDTGGWTKRKPVRPGERRRKNKSAAPGRRRWTGSTVY